jgi:plasmid stability protein
LTALLACAIIKIKGRNMPNLSIRKLHKEVYQRLRTQAGKHGVSMEEEVRRILSQALLAPENICDVFQKHFGLENGVDLDVLDQRKPHNPMDMDI